MCCIFSWGCYSCRGSPRQPPIQSIDEWSKVFRSKLRLIVSWRSSSSHSVVLNYPDDQEVDSIDWQPFVVHVIKQGKEKVAIGIQSPEESHQRHKTTHNVIVWRNQFTWAMQVEDEEKEEQLIREFVSARTKTTINEFNMWMAEIKLQWNLLSRVNMTWWRSRLCYLISIVPWSSRGVWWPN